jgi:hypothetical protein
VTGFLKAGADPTSLSLFLLSRLLLSLLSLLALLALLALLSLLSFSFQFR